MSYRFVCFISYKRDPEVRNRPEGLANRDRKDYFEEFARVFREQLRRYVPADIPTFMDTDLAPGTSICDALSVNLCTSMCMVAIVAPQYFESKWCVAEWNAMAKFEAQRLRPRAGLILPVIFKGRKQDLEAKLEGRNAIDMTHLLDPARQLKNIGELRKIKAIGDAITELAGRLPRQDPVDCGAFRLDLAAADATPQLPEPSPFGR